MNPPVSLALTLTSALALGLSNTPLAASEMISNLGQPVVGTVPSPGSGMAFGTSFLTGPNQAVLDAVTLQHASDNLPAAQSYTVRLYRAIYPPWGGDPDMSVVADVVRPVVSPGGPRSPGGVLVSYTPQAPVVLEPNMEYVVVVSETPAGWPQPSFLFTGSHAFDATGGWRLGQDFFGLDFGGFYFWMVSSVAGHLKLSVTASPVGPANSPPDISQAYATVASLWPPNGKLIPFAVAGISDPDGDPVSVVITSIEQDEPVTVPGRDRTAPDAVLGGAEAGWVRAERLGGDNGRVYRVTFEASDGLPDGLVTGMAYISVPHDRSGTEPIDDGPTSGYYRSW